MSFVIVSHIVVGVLDFLLGWVGRKGICEERLKFSLNKRRELLACLAREVGRRIALEQGIALERHHRSMEMRRRYEDPPEPGDWWKGVS